MTMTEEEVDRRPVPAGALYPFCDHFKANEVLDAQEAIAHAEIHLDAEGLRRWMEEWEL